MIASGMNVSTIPDVRASLKIVVDDFLLLRQAGHFRDYWRPELLGGELFASPSPRGAEPESDEVIPYKLRVEDYELLARSGTIGRIPRTELVDGRIYAVSPQHRPHGYVKDELAYRLRRALEELDLPLSVATEQSVLMPPHNEPMPDIIVTSERRGLGAIPGASVALICEVSTTTLHFDLFAKAAVYAAAGIQEYWVADVDGRIIHQFWQPEDERYREHREIGFGAPIEACAVESLVVTTTSL